MVFGGAAPESAAERPDADQGERPEPGVAAINARLGEFIRVPYDDGSTLAEIGLDSLTTIRVAVGLVPDDDVEIDAGALAHIRTVGQLRVWLQDLMRSSSATGGIR